MSEAKLRELRELFASRRESLNLWESCAKKWQEIEWHDFVLKQCDRILAASDTPAAEVSSPVVPEEVREFLSTVYGVLHFGTLKSHVEEPSKGRVHLTIAGEDWERFVDAACKAGLNRPDFSLAQPRAEAQAEPYDEGDQYDGFPSPRICQPEGEQGDEVPDVEAWRDSFDRHVTAYLRGDDAARETMSRHAGVAAAMFRARDERIAGLQRLLSSTNTRAEKQEQRALEMETLAVRARAEAGEQRARAEAAEQRCRELEQDTNVSALQDDVLELLRAAGLPDHARPMSCHELVRSEIIPAVLGLRERCRELREATEELAALLRIVGDELPADFFPRKYAALAKLDGKDGDGA